MAKSFTYFIYSLTYFLLLILLLLYFYYSYGYFHITNRVNSKCHEKVKLVNGKRHIFDDRLIQVVYIFVASVNLPVLNDCI